MFHYSLYFNSPIRIFFVCPICWIRSWISGQRGKTQGEFRAVNILSWAEEQAWLQSAMLWFRPQKLQGWVPKSFLAIFGRGETYSGHQSISSWIISTHCIPHPEEHKGLVAMESAFKKWYCTWDLLVGSPLSVHQKINALQASQLPDLKPSYARKISIDTCWFFDARRLLCYQKVVGFNYQIHHSTLSISFPTFWNHFDNPCFWFLCPQASWRKSVRCCATCLDEDRDGWGHVAVKKIIHILYTLLVAGLGAWLFPKVSFSCRFTLNYHMGTYRLSGAGRRWAGRRAGPYSW